MIGPLVERFEAKVSPEPTSGCWLWTGCATSDGYGTIWIGTPGARGKERVANAHRVAWELAHGPIPSGLLVCHRCDNPACVNPGHLFLGTNRDNVRDAAAKGRLVGPKPGALHPRAKLTDAAVRAIVAGASAGRSRAALAREHGVTPAAVCSVLCGRTWSHVTGIRR